jgi:hypothetical protein
MLQRIEPQLIGTALSPDGRQTATESLPRVQSQLALRLLAEVSGLKRVGLAPVNPENS